MNTDVVLEAALGTFAGTIPFPDVIKKLIEAGVEYYHVDYVSMKQRFYGTSAESAVVSIPFEAAPVAPEFNAPALRAAILDSQKNGQKFRDFTKRAQAAGVQSYYAFLRGKRVVYIGRTGDMHPEWFPGVKP